MKKLLTALFIISFAMTVQFMQSREAYSFPMLYYSPSSTYTCPEPNPDGTCGDNPFAALSSSSSTILGGLEPIFAAIINNAGTYSMTVPLAATSTYYSAADPTVSILFELDDVPQIYEDLSAAGYDPTEWGFSPPDTSTCEVIFDPLVDESVSLLDSPVTFVPDGATCAPVPEPSTLALMGIGLAGLIGFKIRKRKSA